MRNQIALSRQGREQAMTLLESAERVIHPDPELATNLLAAEPAANMADGVRARHVRQALQRLEAFNPVFEAEARRAADELLEDHRRVRRAADATGRYRVEPVLPVDVIGVYVLVPYRGQ